MSLLLCSRDVFRSLVNSSSSFFSFFLFFFFLFCCGCCSFLLIAILYIDLRLTTMIVVIMPLLWVSTSATYDVSYSELKYEYAIFFSSKTVSWLLGFNVPLTAPGQLRTGCERESVSFASHMAVGPSLHSLITHLTGSNQCATAIFLTLGLQ